jgi:hypothetical protein
MRAAAARLLQDGLHFQACRLAISLDGIYDSRRVRHLARKLLLRATKAAPRHERYLDDSFLNLTTAETATSSMTRAMRMGGGESDLSAVAERSVRSASIRATIARTPTLSSWGKM